MNNQENIEINSVGKNENYSGIKSPENQQIQEKTSKLSDKLKGLKNIIKVSSFFNKNTLPQNESNPDCQKNTNDLQPEAEKSWKDKLQEKIINKLKVKQNILAFVGIISIGCGLIVLSLFLLPVIIITPHKFCCCFAFGGLLITLSFLFLKGTKGYIKSICAPNRFTITIFYFISIILGIGFSLAKKYIFSILCSIYQCIALSLFVLTFVPGGRIGIDCIKNFFASPFTRIFASQISSQMEQ